MNLRILLGVLLGCFCTSVQAGMWDRDRPGDDSLPAVMEVIGQRFDIFPNEYYQARLSNLEPQLGALRAVDLSTPLSQEQISLVADNLGVIDDVAIAQLRLGNIGDAIIMLDWKHRLADAIRDERTATARKHAYRATANKAVCLRERWLTSARPSPDDLKQARDLLQAAVDEDPYNGDAHWSLIEIEWLMRNARYEPEGDPLMPNMLGINDASFRGERDEAALQRHNLSGCIQYLSRRIAYEGATKEVDLDYALSLALALCGRNDEAAFAWLRVCQLLDEGSRTRLTNAPAVGGCKQLMSVHLGKLQDRETIESLYMELRDNSEHWRESRLGYLQKTLAAGKHPDTHADFWSRWSAVDKGVPQAGRPVHQPDPGVSTTLIVGGLAGLGAVLVLILGFAVFTGRRISPPPSIDEV